MCRVAVDISFWLCLILISNVLCIKRSLEIDKSTEEVSTRIAEENLGLSPETLTEIAPKTIATPRNIESPKSVKKEENFRPSVHLGEINDQSTDYEPRASSNPFNNVQHFQFDNSVGIVDADGRVPALPQVAKEQVKFVYDTDSRYATPPSSSPEVPSGPHQEVYGDGYVHIDVPHVYYGPGEAQGITTENPSIYMKPVKFESDGYQTYEYTPSGNDAIDKPEFQNNYQYYYPTNPSSPSIQNPEMLVGKPETVLYLTSHRETSITRTRKFPYKSYQPHDDTGIHAVVEKGYAFPPQRRQISPWQKIIHIIGAFLPLGLLIAALKPPNVIKIDGNSTQPEIVLSKLRGINMPVEHKSGQESEDTCEARSICDTIIRGAEKHSDLVYSIIFDFANRSTDEELRKSELEEIFGAVKRKDCSSIKC